MAFSFPRKTFSHLLSEMIRSADGTNMPSEAAGFRVAVRKHASLTALFKYARNYAGKSGGNKRIAVSRSKRG